MISLLPATASLDMHTPTGMFLFGFIGSIAAEVVQLYLTWMAENEIPERYRNPLFWILRVLLALLGGALAIAAEVKTLWAAFYMGASAVTILGRLSRVNASPNDSGGVKIEDSNTSHQRRTARRSHVSSGKNRPPLGKPLTIEPHSAPNTSASANGDVRDELEPVPKDPPQAL